MIKYSFRNSIFSDDEGIKYYLWHTVDLGHNHLNAKSCEDLNEHDWVIIIANYENSIKCEKNAFKLFFHILSCCNKFIISYANEKHIFRRDKHKHDNNR